MHNDPSFFLSEAARLASSAIAHTNGRESMTFQQVASVVGKIANGLRDSGVQRGHVVVTRLPERLDYLFTLAIWHLGAASCSSRINEFGELVGVANLVVTNHEFDDPSIQVLTVDDKWLTKVLSGPEAPQVGFSEPSDLVRLVLTSGTTGQRKLVPLSLELMLKRVEEHSNRRLTSGPELRLYGSSTSGWASNIMRSLMELQPVYETGLEQGTMDFVQALAAKVNFTCISGSPAQVLGLLETAHTNNWGLGSVAEITSGGTIPPLRLVKLAKDVFGVPITGLYGSSEAGVVTKKFDVQENALNNVGGVIDHADLEIVDSATGLRLPDGLEGEVRFRSPSMADGYLNSDSEAFREGWFYPGDAGYLTESKELVLTGRISERLNINGIKIYPQELDSKIQAIPEIRDAGSFGYKSASGFDRLGIAIVMDTTDVQNVYHVKQSISSLVSLRAGFDLISIDSIPRNAMGKVDRLMLAKMHEGSKTD